MRDKRRDADVETLRPLTSNGDVNDTNLGRCAE